LGGADFGAGILELITGKKGIDTISKAIAPVWEANHVWLILAVVILFNGFPLAYTSLSTYLHIPLLIALIGIIIRGSSFSFRYYDIVNGRNYTEYYSWFFRISSLITPFFLGIILGAVISGRIPSSPTGGFVESFISPWLNGFTFATGLFITLLFAWLAAIYTLGEAKDDTIHLFRRTALSLFILLIIGGVLVFGTAEIYGIHLIRQFKQSIISILCVIIASMAVPIMWRNVMRKNILWTRLLAGVITTCILIGWFAVQFPVMISRSDGNHLTVWNSQAPQITMYYLMFALVIGSLIIFPAFAYLFRIFKFKKDIPADEPPY
jgi:cytochrome d ubiquinol oxidase subunit II